MERTKTLLGVIVALLLVAPLSAADATVVGEYLEVRTADIYTGPCFANGEANLTGKEAVLAWRIREGSWQGAPLGGLSVIAVVKANATLGDPFANPQPTRSVIIVDEKATPEQREALVEFARSSAGELVEDIVAVESAPVHITLNRDRQAATLKAGDILTVQTRQLTHHDIICGNDYVYYPPLTETDQAQPAFTLKNEFKGEGLGTTWSNPHKRSAFIGTFAR